MSPKQLAADIRINMFADRGTDLQDAMEYADQVFNSLGTSNIAARTALHVVLNTLANILDKMLDPADNPATGTAVQQVHLLLDRAALDDIIDARIDQWIDSNGDRIEEHVKYWMDDNFDAEHIVRGALEDIDLIVRVR